MVYLNGFTRVKIDRPLNTIGHAKLFGVIFSGFLSKCGRENYIIGKSIFTCNIVIAFVYRVQKKL